MVGSEKEVIKMSIGTSETSKNHRSDFSSWVNLMKIAARRGRIVPQYELKELIPNDPGGQELLNLMSRIVLRASRFSENPNYYLVDQKEDYALVAGFLTTKDTISAPAPENLSPRHTAFVFELLRKREGKQEKSKWKSEERVIVSMRNGKLYFIGNLAKILPFLPIRR